jgi:hypothetical protein
VVQKRKLQNLFPKQFSVSDQFFKNIPKSFPLGSLQNEMRTNFARFLLNC